MAEINKEPPTEEWLKMTVTNPPNDEDFAKYSPEHDTPADPARLRQIYRKLDLRIIPAFWTLYFLCSAVRANVSLAITMNIAEGDDLESVLNITPHQVSTATIEDTETK